MTRFTRKTIRTETQWVQITRDNEQRKFTFARGYKGNLSAHDIDCYFFKWVANWLEAIDFAQRKVNSYS